VATNITIEGIPLAVFSLDDIPSVNEIPSHLMARRRYNKGWREIGYVLGLSYMNRFVKGRDNYLIQGRGLVVVKCYRDLDSNRGGRFDTHNAYVKPLLDGFTDARIWKDDEAAHLPVVIFTWAYSPSGKKDFEVEIHELGQLVINGKQQVLPRGREGG